MSAWAGMRLPFRPSSAISVNTYAPNESKTLLQRVSGGDSLLSRLNAHPAVLKKGELQVAGMRAQEWLSAYMMGEDGKQFSFAMETIRQAPGPLQPLLYIEFNTGKRGGGGNLPRSAMSEQQAASLWDARIRTIRVRAGN